MQSWISSSNIKYSEQQIIRVSVKLSLIQVEFSSVSISLVQVEVLSMHFKFQWYFIQVQ